MSPPLDTQRTISNMIDADNAQVHAQSTPRSTYKRITPAQRAAICAEVASGKTIAQVAQDFGVHRNSISVLVNNVRKQVNSPALATHRATERNLALKISDDAKLAIHASVQDRDDVHKAAGTGLSWLKGTGELAGDGGVSVFVAHVSQLPADMRAEYVATDDALEIEATPIGLPDDTSTNGS